MTNHVHLLMRPQDVDGISRVMQSVGRRYAQYINYHYRRSGTLWEGNHPISGSNFD
jgi:putative transposase